MTAPLTVVTWNVNSLRVRQAQLLAWLAQHQPDIVCLQELKLETAMFPALTFAQAGYQAAFVGRKTYNGVAVLVKQEHGPLEDIRLDLQSVSPETEARLVSAVVPNLGVQVLSVYVPNGQELISPKFVYKLQWLERFYEHVQRNLSPKDALIIAGDYNIAPDDRDVYNPTLWKDTVICHESVRQAWRGLEQWGLVDAVRSHNQEPGVYTYWDYRQGAFPKNRGLRIDHVLLSAPLAQRGVSFHVDRDVRAATQPSDHAPLVVRVG